MRRKPFLIGLAAAALAVNGLAPFAVAQAPQTLDRRVPRAGEERLSYAPVVRKVAPAVVNVYAAKVVRNRNPLFDDPIFRRFFGDQAPGGGAQVQRSLGSGVIVDPSGLVVTNVHVIEGADEVKIALNDKREYEAMLVLKDPRSDLAVLKLKTSERFPYLDIANSDALQVGDVVIAIGDPFGVGQTVTHGIVSALARSEIGTNNYQFYIQTDAAINPGNSGGALVDLDGKLVGINNAIFSRSGGWQGIGFAIPANMVKVVLASAKSGGKDVKRPWLGAKLQPVTPEIAESLGVKRPAGALVASVLPDSPAGKAGLRDGDLIVAVDGQPVDEPNAFDYRFVTQPLGATAKLTFWRGGKEMVTSVPLEMAPEAPADEITIKSRSPFGGAKVANLSPALADRLQITNVDSGVVVVSVADGSFANSFGFQHGDVVLEVNGQKINSTRDLERVTHNASSLWRVTILRGGQRISAVFGG
jgi:Do/DeqQ family serine protease